MTNLLPAPFMWIHIPSGEVTLNDLGGYLTQKTSVTVQPFAISKYPITNAQYQTFADAEDGYCDMLWWDYSLDALEWRANHDAPVDYRKNTDYSKDNYLGYVDHPRTHISWYDTVAFCRWLSVKTGENIRLPTEAEWQFAAQGNTNNLYPWGNEWEQTRCHNNESQSSIGPTSVNEFEGMGNSPFDVVDMAGNVWEWCLTSWQNGQHAIDKAHVRVLRGGSWFDNRSDSFRTTTRKSWNPEIESDLRGFRIVRT